jgi:hypothetical protein
VVAVERVASGSEAVENELVGIYADVCRDENGVSGKIDEGDKAGGGISGRASVGDHHGELLRLGCRADGIDGADDGPVGVAAADDRHENHRSQSKPEYRPESLRYGPNVVTVKPRLGVSFCFNSC